MLVAGEAIWRFYGFELATRRIVGELRAVISAEPELTYNRFASMTLRAQVSDPVAVMLGKGTHGLLARRYNPRTGGRKVMFAGSILTRNIAAEADGDGTVAFLAVDASWWAFRKRLADNAAGAGRTETGLQYLTPTNRAAIVCDLVEFTNAADGNSRLRASRADQTVTSTATVEKWGGGRLIGACVDDLGGSMDGFDWRCEPAFEDDAQGVVLGRWKSAPRLGIERRHAVFQYGFGSRNATSATYTESMETFANRIHHFAAGREEGYELTRQDDLSVGRYGVWADVADLPGVVDPELRRKWMDINLAVRGQGPRGLAEFKPDRSDRTGVDTDPISGAPVERTPIPGIDYEPADLVHCQAIWGGALQLDEWLRVYSIRITVGAGGAETATLGLYQEGAS